MPTGFVMMLFSKRSPSPTGQIEAMIADCKGGGSTHLLSRKVVGVQVYKSGKSRMAFVGDDAAGRRLLATGVYVRVVTLGSGGRRPGGFRSKLPRVVQAALDKDGGDFKCLVELKNVRRCKKGETLKSLGWKTVAHGNFQIPAFQGGAYFKVKHA